MLKLGKYSIGAGDRFAHQAPAQLEACIEATHAGIEVIPVWNKSFREHSIVGSQPPSAREAAVKAVQDLGWVRPWHTDADHIHLGNVDGFIDCSDFFTIDVAENIGGPVDASETAAFILRHPELLQPTAIPGLDAPVHLHQSELLRIATKYLPAVQAAGRIYRHILEARASRPFITEVSMDETDTPQSPQELLVILAAVADEEIPAQTIAPKFTGRFNKGVDYVGDPLQFEREFNEDISVVAHAVRHYGLPENLKLSVHSGSDKFSIYPAIHRAMRRHDAGVHLKTAGTTWLEELIGLAEHGADGLALAKEVYAEAFAHREELCAPYASVVDIDPSKLPDPAAVNLWTGEQFAAALRHDQSNPAYNLHLRQLLHVGYKVAAKMGERYTGMLVESRESVSRNVKANLWQRHIRPVFLGA
ncbi:MAG: hypothetical protein IH602_03120 [Bryobacteraceae bacterium]|nr:hypothetical protein [Bryobacteraceae bacterium]